MAEENEIKLKPTLVGRVVEGVKDGIGGAILGAAAGAVTGGVLSSLNDAAQAMVDTPLTPAQFDAIEAAKMSTVTTPAAVEAESLASNAYRHAILEGAKDYAGIGALAGASYKGLEGLTSSQEDKKHQVVDAIQAKQIEGVAQLASVALAQAQESKAVLGKFTQLVNDQRNKAAEHGKESHSIA